MIVLQVIELIASNYSLGAPKSNGMPPHLLVIYVQQAREWNFPINGRIDS